MDEALVQAWNALVMPCDVAWYLGKVCSGSQRTASRYLALFNGRKQFIRGNHDDTDALSCT